MSINELIKTAKAVDMFSDILSDEKKEINLKGKIAAAIINKRYELNMSQTEFADKMEVSQTMVSKWESGDYNFTCDTLESILDKIGLSLSIEEKSLLNAHTSNASVEFSDTSKYYESNFVNYKNLTVSTYNKNSYSRNYCFA